MTLIEAIREVQKKHGMDDAKFADTLEIDRGHVCKIFGNKTQPGRKFLSALSQKFPELDYAVLQYMKGKTHASN
jgi:transcriptional regulator with XRE-family HTH domain